MHRILTKGVLAMAGPYGLIYNLALAVGTGIIRYLKAANLRIHTQLNS